MLAVREQPAHVPGSSSEVCVPEPVAKGNVMDYGIGSKLRRMGSAAFLTAVMGTGLVLTQSAWAQAAGAASDQDKQFLQDLGKDSNFEIKTSQLALAKSHSADVKAYARMVVHDHDLIKARIASDDKMAGLPKMSATEMTPDDQAMVDKLNGLSGGEFDTAFIQELVKGNDKIEQEEKSEASDSQCAPVKSLAVSSKATDKKHAAKAKQLAKAHGVQS